MTTDGDYDRALAGWLSDAADAEPDSFGLAPAAAIDPEAIARVREWVRQRFSLAADVAIMVSEVACNQPGCPPLETVVAFWENSMRYHFKLFKPVAEVTSDNLPFAWMKESLIMPEGIGCECC
jgi:nitrate reductase delta subunit